MSARRQLTFDLPDEPRNRTSRRFPGEHPNAVNGRETHNITVGVRLSRREFDCLQALADAAGLYHSTMAADLLLAAMRAAEPTITKTKEISK